jgi:hypothetical protein
VTVNEMACGATIFGRAGSATTMANGAWSLPVKPVVNTVYQATWKNAKSAQLTEKVAPVLSLKRLRARRFTASLTAAQAFTGKYVVLQRYARAKRTWKTVKRVTLRKAKPGVAPTIVTPAGFRATVARGTRLRLVLTQDQAGPCYATARSPAIGA